MNKNTLGLLGILLVLVLAGCGVASQSQVRHFRGHWISGEAIADFTTLDGSWRYWLDENSLPFEVLKYIDSQPVHDNPYEGTGPCHVVYLELLGTVKPYPYDPPRTIPTLYVKKVLKWGPARPGFFKTPPPPWPPFTLTSPKERTRA